MPAELRDNPRIKDEVSTLEITLAGIGILLTGIGAILTGWAALRKRRNGTKED